MPKGVWKRTEWHKSRLKNTFQKGHKLNVGNNWNKGKTRPEEVRRKISESSKGTKNHFFGKKHSEESIQKMKYSHKGQVAWNRGKEMSTEHRSSLKRYWDSLREIKGENHHSWKGGYHKWYQALRRRIDFKEWRKQVFGRDSYTCQICKQKGKYLHPHHIKQVSKYPCLIFDVDNGITLCKECHMRLHNLWRGD